MKIDQILEDQGRHAKRIAASDAEAEYQILGYKDVAVSVPFSYLADADGRCGALERLLRKDVPGDTILAFIEKAKADGRWGVKKT